METVFSIFFLFTLKIILGKIFIRKKYFFRKRKNIFLNQKEKQIIGFRSRVLETFNDSEKTGRIKILDSYWKIRSQNVLKVGEVVEVYKVVGNTLYVKNVTQKNKHKIF